MSSSISFKFTKSTKKTTLNGIKDESKDDEEKILSIEDQQIESTKPKIEKKELIIPLIKQNNWRNATNGTSLPKTEQDLLNEKAAAEILQETQASNVEWNNRKIENENFEIPLMMRNKIPEGFETDDKLDVSLRPEVSTLDDYEQVPIDQFGKAMLRGMGWKKEEGIGGRNKQVVKPIEAVVRPKGLGLGADAKLVQKVKSGDKEALEEQNFVKGGYVRVHHGPHRNQYGQIEGIDEDNSRVNLVMALNSNKLTLSKFILTVVSKKEYKKESKILNKDKYMEYVHKKDEEHKRERGKRKHKTDSYSDDNDERSHRKKKKKEKSSKYHDDEASRHRSPWVRPYLKVRFIDKKYKSGKYFNTKVTVEDVVSESNCICQTDSGRLLEDIHPTQLETVIPKNENANVMIVGHKYYNAKIGKIIKRDKSKCQATVQLLEDHSLVKIHFDSVCEYVGELPEYL